MWNYYNAKKYSSFLYLENSAEASRSTAID